MPEKAIIKVRKPKQLHKFSQITIRECHLDDVLSWHRPYVVICTDSVIDDIVSEIRQIVTQGNLFIDLIETSFGGDRQYINTLPENCGNADERRKYINRILHMSSAYIFLLPPITDKAIYELFIDAAHTTIPVITFINNTDIRSVIKYLVALGADDHDIEHKISFVRWPNVNALESIRVGIMRDDIVRERTRKEYIFPAPVQINLDSYISLIRQSMIKRWSNINGDPVHTGIKNINDLRHRFSRGHAKYISVLSATSKEAFGVLLPNGLVELWVHVGLSRRRYYQIWCTFIRKIHGVNYKKENRRRYQLDHSHNVKTALVKSDAQYVLLTPVEARINSAWGFIERALAYDGMSGTNMQLANWFSMPKLLGIRPPSFSKTRNFDKEVERIFNELRAYEAVGDNEFRNLKEGFAHFAKLVRRGIENSTKPSS